MPESSITTRPPEETAAITALPEAVEPPQDPLAAAAGRAALAEADVSEADADAYPPPDAYEALVPAAQAGDTRALSNVMAAMYSQVLAYCRKRLGYSSDVWPEDIAQEVCLAVIAALPNLAPDESLRAYVYGIANNKVVDVYRASGRNRTDPVGLEVSDIPIAISATPEALFLAAERKSRLDRLLEELTGHQRDILHARYALGLSVRETSDLLQVQPGAVRVATHRAKNRLRRLTTERSIEL